MFKYLLAGLFLFIISFGHAQNRASVKGTLVDSLTQKPVEMATVAIINVNDTTSSLVSYTLSTKTGEFNLHNLPAGISLKVLITFVGYKPYRKFFTLGKGENIDLGIITLASKQLNEVTISGERVPIVVRADTIEFNAEAFKTRPNAVVEDLLKKLPGIQVDNDGKITVNGKNISKIMIDGKEFFANDPKIASKNLDASLIAKVQVYDDRENDPDHLIEDSKVDKIINLKFKKALKKSVFGKVYAGGGTQGRFESGGLYNMFRDTLQISLIGVGNNLNKTGFSRSELNSSGGFNRAGDNVLDAGTNLGGRNYGGIQTVATGGFNINNDYGKKLKLNLVYFFSHTETVNNNQSNNQQFLPTDTLITKSKYSQTASDNKHNLSGSVKWNPDTATQIKYTPLLSFSANKNESNAIALRNSYLLPNISQNTNISNTTGDNMQFQHSFSYYRKLKHKNESITINHNLSINPGTNNGYNNNQLISYVKTLPSDTLDRYSHSDTKSSSVGASVAYRRKLFKNFIGDITLSTNYSKRGSDLFTYDFDTAKNRYDIYLDSLSSDVTRRQWEEGVRPGFTYNFTKRIILIAGLKAQWQQINNQFNKNIADLNQHYFYLLPNVQLRLWDVSLSYDASVQQPDINDLQPIRYVYSPLYTYTGNPDLVPTRRNNLGLSYYAYSAASQINFYLNVSGSIEENSIYRQRTINNVGAQTSMPINRNGQYNVNVNVNFGKRFKKAHDVSLGLFTYAYFYTANRFFQLNADEGFQNTYYTSVNQSLSLNWKDVIQFDPSYTINFNKTSYTGVKYEGLNYITQNLTSRFTAFLPHKFNIEGVYTYTYNPLVSNGYQRSTNLLSMNLAKQFLKKDRGEIRLTCYDILNQNVSVYRYASENAITDSQSQILKRYFMLTLQYKFNKAITK